MRSVHRLVELSHKSKTMKLWRWFHVNITCSHTHRKSALPIRQTHCEHQSSSTFVNSFCHHVADHCLQTLHWWHCREHIARLKFLVFRLGLLDLSHDQSSSDLFSHVFRRPISMSKVCLVVPHIHSEERSQRSSASNTHSISSLVPSLTLTGSKKFLC